MSKPGSRLFHLAIGFTRKFNYGGHVLIRARRLPTYIYFIGLTRAIIATTVNLMGILENLHLAIGILCEHTVAIELFRKKKNHKCRVGNVEKKAFFRTYLFIYTIIYTVIVMIK